MIISGNSNINNVYYSGYTISKIYACGGSLVWSGGTGPTPPTPYENQYLTFEMLSSGLPIEWIGSTSANTLSYSLDSGSTWSEPSSAVVITSDIYQVGDKIMFKGNMTPEDFQDGIGNFENAPSINVEGNIMSLIYGDNFIGQKDLTGKVGAFSHLFVPIVSYLKIRSAENLILPATTLSKGCYSNMFGGCETLTAAPELPATTLASLCYYEMFRNCTSLTTAPALPATTLAGSCYTNMFRGCTSLTAAPELPATTLASYCYSRMFNSCTSLNNITCLATDVSATNCTEQWVNGVAANGTFTKASGFLGWSQGVDGIPNGWTVQDA